MPRLKIAYGLGDLRGQDCYSIDMDEWGYSNNLPLATVGAGPCLNVVVHAGNVGCLTHIWNSSLNQTELYHKACFTIRDMIHCIGSLINLDIWLGAGWAFGPNEKFVPYEKAALDFPVYLSAFLEEVGCQNVNIIDCRTTGPNTYWNPGDIAYSPATGKVHLISNKDASNEESGLYKVQTGKKPAKRGVAK